MFDTYTYMIEQAKYMLGRFNIDFHTRYAQKPHRAQVECGRADDGFGNIISKGLEGHRATQLFLFLES